VTHWLRLSYGDAGGAKYELRSNHDMTERRYASCAVGGVLPPLSCISLECNPGDSSVTHRRWRAQRRGAVVGWVRP